MMVVVMCKLTTNVVNDNNSATNVDTSFTVADNISNFLFTVYESGSVPITIDIIHGTGLETNHVRQLVVYILYSAMRVWDSFMYSAISQEN